MDQMDESPAVWRKPARTLRCELRFDVRHTPSSRLKCETYRIFFANSCLLRATVFFAAFFVLLLSLPKHFPIIQLIHQATFSCLCFFCVERQFSIFFFVRLVFRNDTCCRSPMRHCRGERCCRERSHEARGCRHGIVPEDLAKSVIGGSVRKAARSSDLLAEGVLDISTPSNMCTATYSDHESLTLAQVRVEKQACTHPKTHLKPRNHSQHDSGAWLHH